MKDFELFGFIILFGITIQFMYLHYRLDKLADWAERELKNHVSKNDKKRDVA